MKCGFRLQDPDCKYGKKPGFCSVRINFPTTPTGMLTKAFALLSQTFRVDVRQLRTHLLRGGIAAGVLWMLMIVHLDNPFRNSPGLMFCEGLTFSTMVLLTLMGAFYFPSVITEEKEEQTLGLLRMAGVGSVTLLLGKSVAKVGVVLLLIAVSLPYWWLCVTLGGVTPSQIWAVAISLAAHLALMSQIGTLCSVYFTTTGRACVAAMIVIVMLLLGPIIADVFLRELRLIGSGNNFFRSFYAHFAPWQLSMIMSPGYGGGVWNPQVETNTLAALVLFGLSWFLLDRINTYDQVPGREMRLVGWAKSLLPAAIRRRARRRASAGSVGAAISWKDFWQFGGGYRWWYFRCVGYASMAFLASLDRWGSLMQRIGVALILTAFWAGIAEIVFHAGHLFHREVKQQTWDSLRMLPVSTGFLARRKIRGALWAMVPTFTALAGGLILEWRLLEEIFREFDRHPILSFCISFYCFAGTILACYLACYFSLRVNPWLGTVISAGVFGFISATPFMCCFGLMDMDGNDTAGFVFFAAAVLDLSIAAGFHIPISATLRGETNG
ncbi:hypothetical protein AYO47_07080 [Planctomyces sp. SCGC AG-212-M04]|nr:hypothetical protein AYO47_07080 [Planctomyces sp. SCGC AG-212-M04]